MAELLNDVELEEVAGGQTIRCRWYTIVRGDTLSALAIKFKTTIAMLLQLNPSITNPNRIYIGQKILVPVTT